MSEVMLKPCPFCGGEAKVWRSKNDYPNADGYWIECVGCAASTKKHDKRVPAEASWNTRAMRGDGAALRAALVEKAVREFLDDIDANGRNTITFPHRVKSLRAAIKES